MTTPSRSPTRRACPTRRRCERSARSICSAQPVVLELQHGRQVVQDDCRAAFDDPVFQAMLETYGGLAAQIVTPVFAGGRLAAIVSLHQLGTPRSWTEAEAAACTRAAARVGELL